MVKKLYEKSEIWFAVVWIFAYVVLASMGDAISADIGILKIVTVPILVLLSVVLFLFITRNGLSEKYGLCKPRMSASKMLFYIPLMVLLTANLWHGVALQASPLETLLYVASMLCVGFLEEMIFRGFLFHAMTKNGAKTAIIVSSATFGMGHMVNLFNGSSTELLQSMLQVIYAMAIGFAFVMVYCKTRSLLPCIATHSLFNAASAFENNAAITPQSSIVTCVVISAIASGYAVYIALTDKDSALKQE